MKNKITERRNMRLIQKQTTGLRQRTIMLASFAVIAIVGITTVIFNLGSSTKTYAAANGDYRSKATGNWSSTSTWEKYNGSAWVAATASPTSTDGVITIQAGNTVSITTNVTIDQTVVNATGAITVNAAKILTINSGTGTDVTINGTLTNNGTVSQNALSSILDSGLVVLSVGSTSNLAAGSTFTINSGGRVRQNGGGGSAVSNYLFVNSGGVYQHNMDGGAIPPGTWATGSTCEITGVTVTVPINITQAYGNFTWNCPSQTGNIDLAGGITTVNGNFALTSSGSGELRLSTASSNLTIAGDYIQTGGTLRTVNGINNIDSLFVAGNWTHTGGILTMGGNISSRTQIVFNKSGTQTFTTSNNTVSGKVNYIIKTGSILNTGTSILKANDITVQSGSTLMIGSTGGITTLGLTGNIQAAGNYIYNGTGAQATGDALPSSVTNLTINNSNGVTLTNTVSVTGTLALTSGVINTNTNELKVINTSTTAITGYSSSNYIIGNLRRSVSGSASYIYPVGTAANYEPANINLSSVTGITDILGTFTNASPIDLLYPLLSIVISGTPITDILNYGYWTLTPNTPITGGSYSVTLNEKGQSNAATNPGAYCVLKRVNALSSWQSLGTHDNNTQSQSGGIATAVRSGLTSFSQFSIGSAGGGALPIELINFIVKPDNNVVDIKWSTATEKNNDYFNVERSTDGRTFENIERVNGAGNSSRVLNYITTDSHPASGKSYYRLKQTDFNGAFTYSPVRVVDLNDKSTTENTAIQIKSIAPNPFNQQFSVTYNSESAGEVEVMLINMNGQIMHSEKLEADAGVDYYDYIDEKNIPVGNYILTIILGDKKASKKIMKSNN